MTAENAKQQRPERLRRLELLFVRSPIYFVTTCTDGRRSILASTTIHENFVRFANEGPAHGAWIGAYVLMPDHLHAFVAYDDEKISLVGWMKSLKNALSKTSRSNGIPAPHWQKTFSIMCYAAPNLTQRNGTTYARTQCERDLLKIGKIGRFAAKSLTWSIAPRRSDSAVVDRRYRRTSRRRRRRRCVIVHDPPSFRKTPEDEGESSVGLILRAF